MDRELRREERPKKNKKTKTNDLMLDADARHAGLSAIAAGVSITA